MIFFALAAGFSLSSSIARSGYADAKVAGAERTNAAAHEPHIAGPMAAHVVLPVAPEHLRTVVERLEQANRRQFATDEEIKAEFRRFDA